MRTIEKVVERLRQMPRLTKVLRESRGLINTTDLLVATAATVVLASGVGGAAIATLSESKYGKAQPDGQAIGGALSAFYKDTGKWPGQAEQAVAVGESAKATFLVTTGTSAAAEGTGVFSNVAPVLPLDLANSIDSAISVTEASCQNNSLEGFVGVTISAGALKDARLLNINNYLVNKPDPALYQNWKGPYLQADIKTDPWDRAWVLNLQPLYCSESITGSSTAGSTAGSLGYAWLLSGGTNRTVSTRLKDANLDPTGDDAGANLGKLVARGAGGADAGTTTPGTTGTK